VSVTPPGPEWILSGSHHPGEGNKELLECARRAWPRVISYARRQAPMYVAIDEKDSLATEVWESVLYSVSKTLRRKTRPHRKILNLESYLIGAFQHRLNRALKREKRRERTIELIPSHELARRADNHGIDWASELQRNLEVQQIVAQMDDWTRVVWVSRQYGYSWREIAAQHGMNEPQAKMRFRYAIEKIRRHLMGVSANGCDRNKKSGGGL
jgi:DNA-directed RNA polymerase specialized sigma24 family protein